MVGLLGVLFCSEELGKESLINASAGFVLCGQESRTVSSYVAAGQATWLLRGCGPVWPAVWLSYGLGIV